VLQMNRNGSQDINKRIFKNGFIPGDTTTRVEVWGYSRGYHNLEISPISALLIPIREYPLRIFLPTQLLTFEDNSFDKNFVFIFLEISVN